MDFRRLNGTMKIVFILNSILLGLGLSMDAFSVSIVDGLSEPHMSRSRMCGIAGIYAFCQFVMPMAGWFCVRTVVRQFVRFQSFIHWIALFLLCFIGGKMLVKGIRRMKQDQEERGIPEDTVQAEKDGEKKLSPGIVVLQGLVTSIDTLSVGFTIAGYGVYDALLCALTIAAVTFACCMAGLVFGKKFGEHFNNKASVFGGIILIATGVEIFIRSFL